MRVALNAKTVAAVQDALPQLPLQCLHLNCAYESWTGWDLRQLTQLTELHLQLPRFTFMQNHHVQLPQQLLIFGIKAHGRLDPFVVTPIGTELEDGQMSNSVLPPLVQNLTDLQQLQAFSSSTYNSLNESVIQFLLQLTSLQDISLGYDSILAAAGNSKDWVKLKQLQRLSILWCWHDDLYFGRHELEDVMEDLGAVTSLTSVWVSLILGVMSCCNACCQLSTNPFCARRHVYGTVFLLLVPNVAACLNLVTCCCCHPCKYTFGQQSLSAPASLAVLAAAQCQRAAAQLLASARVRCRAKPA